MVAMTNNENPTINHSEAIQLAAMKASESNLARCYLDLVDLISRSKCAVGTTDNGDGTYTHRIDFRQKMVGDGSN